MGFDIRIEPSGPLGGYISVPPSKNYTSRIILAAALAEGESLVRNPATNDDALALVRCCRAMGAEIENVGRDLRIVGVGGKPRNPGVLNPDNAGAVLRLLLGTACLIEGEVRLETDHKDSLGIRPNEDLLKALRSLGAEAEGGEDEGCLPIQLRGGRSRVRGGETRVSGIKSSQFLSSLLFLTPMLEGDSIIRVTGETEGDPPTLVSRPLIDQSLDVLRSFGASIQSESDGFTYRVKGGTTYASGSFPVNGDWPSAAALMSIVATGGGMAALMGLKKDAQGERRAQDALEEMGCVFRPNGDHLMIHSKGNLRAIRFNGDLATDAVLVLLAAAALAEGTSRFENIGNLRIKETDRIAVPLEEMDKIGVSSRSGPDWIEIDGSPEGYEGGVETDARGDHRIAQLLSIVGIRCARGLTIRGAECVSKSYPSYFSDIERLGVKLSLDQSGTGA